MDRFTKLQLTKMNQLSVVAISLLGVMVLMGYLFTKYMPTLHGKPFLAIVFIPFVLALLTFAFMGIKYRVLGTFFVKFPTYHGKRAQIVGYLFIAIAVFAIVYLLII